MSVGPLRERRGLFGRPIPRTGREVRSLVDRKLLSEEHAEKWRRLIEASNRQAGGLVLPPLRHDAEVRGDEP